MRKLQAHSARAVVLAALLLPVWGCPPSKTVKHGNVGGIVIDQSTGEPIASARVQVGEHRATSDVNGAYELADLETGSVSVLIQAEGYMIVRAQVSVVEKQTATANAALRPDVEPPCFPGSLVCRVDETEPGARHLMWIANGNRSERKLANPDPLRTAA
jgi:hypothetical protein